MSKELGGLVVRECKASEFKDCDLVFSGLDSDVAGDIGDNPSPLLALYLTMR
jgi:aspartate-semialdehyde dehydrogenase